MPREIPFLLHPDGGFAVATPSCPRVAQVISKHSILFLFVIPLVPCGHVRHPPIRLWLRGPAARQPLPVPYLYGARAILARAPFFNSRGLTLLPSSGSNSCRIVRGIFLSALPRAFFTLAFSPAAILNASLLWSPRVPPAMAFMPFGGSLAHPMYTVGTCYSTYITMQPIKASHIALPVLISVLAAIVLMSVKIFPRVCDGIVYSK